MLGGIMLAGTVYVLSSYATLSLMGIECSERFLPVALSFVLIALFFGILGVWVGVYKPAIQSPLVVAGLTVFTAYCLTRLFPHSRCSADRLPFAVFVF